MALGLPLAVLAVGRLLSLLPRFLKFGVVGLVGVGVNLGLLFALTAWAHLFYLISAAVAIEAAIMGNFLLHYLWTWGDRKRAALPCIIKFHTVSFIGLTINLGVLAALTQGIHLQYLLSDALGIGLATVWNFYANDLWTFRGRGQPRYRGNIGDAPNPLDEG